VNVLASVCCNGRGGGGDRDYILCCNNFDLFLSKANHGASFGSSFDHPVEKGSEFRGLLGPLEGSISQGTPF